LKIVGLIPARSGSQRVKNKNILNFYGYPLLAYTIANALESKIFSKLIISSDSQKIIEVALNYGVHEYVLRPKSISKSTSTDFDWINHLMEKNFITADYFAILRPTSPFRSSRLIRTVYKKFKSSNFDSIRTVKLVKDHPGKVWSINSQTLVPLFKKKKDGQFYHALQYKSLPKLYVQTSVLEIARTEVITKFNNREGAKIMPFITEGIDSLAIDTKEDLQFHKYLVDEKLIKLPKIKINED
jgi:CMP-N-acetylneuraminic acid synthetase